MSSTLTISACLQVDALIDSTRSPQERQVYIAADISTPEEVATAQSVIEQVESILYPEDFIRVDALINDTTQVSYASAPDRAGLWAVSEALTVQPSSDTAKVSVLYVVKDLCEQYPNEVIYAVFLTSGTSAQKAISHMEDVAAQVVPCGNVHLLVLGVSPTHRAPFSRAFSPLSDHVQFATSPEEISSVLLSLH